ncbi:MAG: replication-associated recombination protein A [candidate division Zixibacteria bacterium]|nr:replication-associated recombination protein A [candidate division Zixibacteria bacterium]MBU1472099.1 replication-associated recombination protein A [candidate division Zixibacteria bacterium]MBU2626199.1 replication-associated recombination protein A [candidate division Zixibacteria bacterium]
MDLFREDAPDSGAGPPRPLAERMRPKHVSDFVGQEHLIGKGKPIARAIEQKKIPSMILWGPPGCGKTTLAHVLSESIDAQFVFFSAVVSGLKDVKKVVERAESEWVVYHRRTVLFIDEIHRFNKAQQDYFLPFVEKGSIILLGATTENPSFEVIGPLLSRCQVYTLKQLLPDDIKGILRKALEDSENGVGDYGLDLENDVFDFLVAMSSGDARRALSYLELIAEQYREETDKHITLKIAENVLQEKTLLYDKSGEEHYNIISALHKAVRGSDVDAALYWLCRMLYSGENPLYIVRRLIRMAMEDIGAADPNALTICVAAKDTYHFLGSPEGELALVEATVYLATAPKSNRLYKAHKAVMREIQASPAEPVPLHIRNAPTQLMKDLEYGKGYEYAHDYDEGFVDQEYLPESLQGRTFYEPSKFGFEKTIQERIDWWKKLKGK